MGFSPTKYDPLFRINLAHDDYPGVEFGFAFQKEWPREATEQDQKYVGMGDAVREEAKREQLLRTVGAMLVETPTGFDGLAVDDRPLADRLVEYYAVITEPGLKSIFASIFQSAWYRFKLWKIPQVYLRPLENNIAERNGDGSSTVGDQPGV